MSDALYFFVLGFVVGGASTCVLVVLVLQSLQERISKRMRR